MGQLNSFEPPQEVSSPITTDTLELCRRSIRFNRLRSLGTGGYKLGANYGPAVMPQKMANSQGYTQNLWLHGPDHCLTEVGTMNMFVAFKRGESKKDLFFSRRI